MQDLQRRRHRPASSHPPHLLITIAPPTPMNSLHARVWLPRGQQSADRRDSPPYHPFACIQRLTPQSLLSTASHRASITKCSRGEVFVMPPGWIVLYRLAAERTLRDEGLLRPPYAATPAERLCDRMRGATHASQRVPATPAVPPRRRMVVMRRARLKLSFTVKNGHRRCPSVLPRQVQTASLTDR